MDLEALVLPQDAVDADRLLHEWAWLLEGPHRVVLVTKMGDAFLADEGGNILFLDTLEGTLAAAAPSRAAFRQMFQAGALPPQWFNPDMVAIMEGRGDRLGPGECFAYQNPPVLGGSLASSNVKAMSAVVHFSVTGQLHRQIRERPRGTRLGGFKFDGGS